MFVNDQFFCSYTFRKTPNYTIHNVVILFTRAEDKTMVSDTETTGSTTADEPQETWLLLWILLLCAATSTGDT